MFVNTVFSPSSFIFYIAAVNLLNVAIDFEIYLFFFLFYWQKKVEEKEAKNLLQL